MPASSSDGHTRRGERGFALVVVLGVLLLALVLGHVATHQAVTGLAAANERQSDKRAIQAADAAMRTAVYRLNAVSLDLDQLLRPTAQCLVTASLNGPLSLLNAVGGWCPATQIDLGDGVRGSFRVSPAVNLLPPAGPLVLGTVNYMLSRRVVATGTVEGQTRRVYAEFTAQGNIVKVSILGLALIQNVHLAIYRMVPGSFRECSSHATSSAPDSGC